MIKKTTLRDRLIATLFPHSHEEELKSLIEQKKILVSGIPATSLDRMVSDQEHVSLYKEKQYVGRGAQKLLGALDSFSLSVNNAVCADVGSSTGGFTQVLLERGAKKVYAIDVGYGELAWQVRSDKRVFVMERTNAREVATLPEKIDFVTIDLSFISILKVLTNIKNWLSDKAIILALIKPQFESNKEEIPTGGVIEDINLNRKILLRTITEVKKIGFSVSEPVASVIKGGDGNQEWFVTLSQSASTT